MQDKSEVVINVTDTKDKYSDTVTLLATSPNEDVILERIMTGEDPEVACKDLIVKFDLVPLKSLSANRR